MEKKSVNEYIEFLENRLSLIYSHKDDEETTHQVAQKLHNLPNSITLLNFERVYQEEVDKFMATLERHPESFCDMEDPTDIPNGFMIFKWSTQIVLTKDWLDQIEQEIGEAFLAEERYQSLLWREEGQLQTYFGLILPLPWTPYTGD